MLQHVTAQHIRRPPIEAVVFGWGVAEDGQLGLDSLEDVMAPKVVESLLGTRLSGRQFRRTPLISGSRCTLAIDHIGQLWSWGWNDRGTLGHGHRGPQLKPKAIAALKGKRVVQAAVGGWHCLALCNNGEVYAWGGNEYTQCGVATAQRDVILPTLCVPQLKVVQVSCGGMHSLALTDHGLVWQWGEPWGDFSVALQREPCQVPGIHNITAIASGAFHNLALAKSGEVYAWGTNDYGQLGNGSTRYQTTPGLVVDLQDAPMCDVAAGGWHSLAISTSGTVYTWGRGEYGRLGIGDKSGSSKLRPQEVTGLLGHHIVQASCGGSHTMCLTAEGRLFVFGRGSFGRLGQGSEKNFPSPVELNLPGGLERWKVIAIAAGGRHSVCLALPVHSLSDDNSSVSACGGGSDDDRCSSPDVGELSVWNGVASSSTPLPIPTDSHRGGDDDNGDVRDSDGGIARNASSQIMPLSTLRAAADASVPPRLSSTLYPGNSSDQLDYIANADLLRIARTETDASGVVDQTADALKFTSGGSSDDEAGYNIEPHSYSGVGRHVSTLASTVSIARVGSAPDIVALRKNQQR